MMPPDSSLAALRGGPLCPSGSVSTDADLDGQPIATMVAKEKEAIETASRFASAKRAPAAAPLPLTPGMELAHGKRRARASLDGDQL